PCWWAGVGWGGGLALPAGSFILSQSAPRLMVSRTIQLALLSILVVTAGNVEFVTSLRGLFNVRPVAERIRDIQADDRAVGVLGTYDGRFNFPGRLERPLAALGNGPDA